MFSPLRNITNEETLGKGHLQSISHNGKFKLFPPNVGKPSHEHYCESTPFAVSKEKWDTKEDTGKSMKHALYALQYD